MELHHIDAERLLMRMASTLASGGEDGKCVKDIVNTDLVPALDACDDHDVFGTEGWKHYFGVED
ncbi:hypothetical protein KAJ83_01470 [Marivibrio halodurans]|uniref:Uncharacterized protein n=1 Tax=Marivibrio halodurans TaxID=2039722 RepID=A0A8J7UZG3_9PROT|nr:hypothetical protein [Marivibrio halodurans]MBP5855661.1 hypothetical protein [Marivibrio halodurans]